MLGFSKRTFESCKALGLKTIGDLRRTRPRDLGIAFGKPAYREACDALKATGRGFQPELSQEEMWRHELLTDKNELVRPTDDSTRIEELSPFIGYAIVHTLKSAGVATLGELRKATLSGELLRIRGVGAGAERRAREYFGLAEPRAGRRGPPVPLAELQWPPRRSDVDSDDAQDA